LIHVARKVAPTDKIRCGAQINDRIFGGGRHHKFKKDGSAGAGSAASAACKFLLDPNARSEALANVFRPHFFRAPPVPWLEGPGAMPTTHAANRTGQPPRARVLLGTRLRMRADRRDPCARPVQAFPKAGPTFQAEKSLGGRLVPKTALLLKRPTAGACEYPSVLLRTIYRDRVHRLWQAR